LRAQENAVAAENQEHRGHHKAFSPRNTSDDARSLTDF
jgi:hypothetical protein